MDYGNFSPLKPPVTYISSDAIIYRELNDGSVEILTGIRGHEPWKGGVSGGMGGYVEPADVSIATAAQRESIEEVGLIAEIDRLVGVYGPERWHYTFHRDNGVFVAKKTNKPAHIRPVVACVFSARVVGGALTETAEQSGLRWQKPEELVGKTIVFDQALALAHFLDPSRKEVGEQALQLIH